jgi:hypothetical protein
MSGQEIFVADRFGHTRKSAQHITRGNGFKERGIRPQATVNEIN